MFRSLLIMTSLYSYVKLRWILSIRCSQHQAFWITTSSSVERALALIRAGTSWMRWESHGRVLNSTKLTTVPCHKSEKEASIWLQPGQCAALSTFEGSIFSDKPFDSWQDDQRDGKIKDDIRNRLTKQVCCWYNISCIFLKSYRLVRYILESSYVLEGQLVWVWLLVFAKALTFGMRKIRRSNWWVLEGNLLKASLIFVVWFCIPRCQSRAKLY